MQTTLTFLFLLVVLAGVGTFGRGLFDRRPSLQRRLAYFSRSLLTFGLFIVVIVPLLIVGAPFWAVCLATVAFVLAGEPLWRRADAWLKGPLRRDSAIKPAPRQGTIERIRNVQQHMVRARDEERRLLAARIHDEPIQKLVSCLVRLDLMRGGAAQLPPEIAGKQMEQIATLVEQAEKSLRQVMKEVFPSLLSDLGLITGIKALCDELNASGMAPHPISVQLDLKGLDPQWSPPLPVSLAIYRFLEEGLRNLLSHSNGRNGWVTVEYCMESAKLELLDDGKGIDPAQVLAARQDGSPKLGLLSLEERIGALGGRFAYELGQPHGTRLYAEFLHHAPPSDPNAKLTLQYVFNPPDIGSSGDPIPARNRPTT